MCTLSFDEYEASGFTFVKKNCEKSCKHPVILNQCQTRVCEDLNQGKCLTWKAKCVSIMVPGSGIK